MAGHLLRISLPSLPRLYFYSGKIHGVKYKKRRLSGLFPRRRLSRIRKYCSSPGVFVLKSLEIGAQSQESPTPTVESVKPTPNHSAILLDVSGMMCGGCVARVKSILTADDRVESAVVNMLIESAAVRLKPEVEVAEDVAETLAKRLTDCGFDAKRRVSGLGVAEKVKKWKEMANKKEELLGKSRNRVAFAWTLVALCCGSHTSHILHSLGIHIAHGTILINC